MLSNGTREYLKLYASAPALPTPSQNLKKIIANVTVMPGAGGARLLLAAGRRLRSVPAAVSPQKRAFYGLFGRGRDADNKAQVLDNFCNLA